MTCEICGEANAELVHYEGRCLCEKCNVWREVLGDGYSTSEDWTRRYDDRNRDKEPQV